MEKHDELKKTYIEATESMASKSRFGYFNMPPSCFLADNAFPSKKVRKDENGKVITENRNIFSGVTATGVLKKNFFSYNASYVPGDVYFSPGKLQSMEKLALSQKFQDKDTFKPVSLGKEPSATLTYDYVPQKPLQKDPKSIRDENGKVKTANPNMKTNNSLKAHEQRQRQYKKMMSQSAFIIKQEKDKPSISKQKQAKEAEPFKLGNRGNGDFSTYKDTYGGQVPPLTKKSDLSQPQLVQTHDANFKPSNRSLNRLFSKPQYIPEKCQSTTPAIKKSADSKKDPFKLVKIEKISKPTPSISLCKMNIMRGMR